MFEGLVHRVLVGYLGRYFKNIQKEQLKLSLWNGNFYAYLFIYLSMYYYRNWWCLKGIIVIKSLCIGFMA